MARIRALIRKEFIQFLRNKAIGVVYLYVIAVEIAVCAYAITYDVSHIAIAVRDLDGSLESRELVKRFSATPNFDVPVQVTSSREMEKLIETGRATVGVEIPPDFSRRIGENRTAPVQLLIDGANSNTAIIALGYAQGIVGRYARELELKRLAKSVGDPGPLPRVALRTRAWYSQELTSRHFVVISMLVLAVAMVAILHPAAALAWEKESGTIEQLLVMPFRTWELIAAKVLPTFAVSLVCLALSLWVPWWFDVPMRGSLVLFFALSAVFVLSAAGLGLLFGAIVQNLQQALLLGFFAIFPLFVISGNMVPIESMPRAVQLLSYLSPLRYYLDIGLGIFLKGVGLEVLWPQALAMGGLGIGIFSLGLWRARRMMG